MPGRRDRDVLALDSREIIAAVSKVMGAPKHRAGAKLVVEKGKRRAEEGRYAQDKGGIVFWN